MPLVVNSNISSLNAQRQLLQVGADLDKASERLASGRRINSAADDAAGLAISNRQTSAIRGLDQAVRNANDGISMLQTAEGALDETTNILQRMRELAIQSSNGIYSDTDRATLNAETQQLKAEIDRIAATTSFNGQKILDGTLGDVTLQVGSEANQTISFSIGTLDADNLGGSVSADITSSAIDFLSASLADDVTINGQVIDDADLEGAATLDDFLEVLNNGLSGVEASLVTEAVATADGTGIIRGTDELNIDLTKTDGTTINYEITDTGSMEELVDRINEVAGNEITASLNDDGRLVLASDSGATITVSDGSGTTEAAAAGFTTGTAHYAQLQLTDTAGDGITLTYADATDAIDLGIDIRTNAGEITGQTITDGAGIGIIEGELSINGVEIGAATADTVAANMIAINAVSAETGVIAKDGVSGTSGITLQSIDGSEIQVSQGSVTGANIGTAIGFRETNDLNTFGDAVSNIDISTVSGAQDAISIIDEALEQINTVRSDIGAVSNRLDFTVSNLSNISEKTSAARSRIVDADFAAETAQLSRSQVLQQASQAMLAQANARPQQVLSLLQ